RRILRPADDDAVVADSVRKALGASQRAQIDQRSARIEERAVLALDRLGKADDVAPVVDAHRTRALAAERPEIGDAIRAGSRPEPHAGQHDRRTCENPDKE